MSKSDTNTAAGKPGDPVPSPYPYAKEPAFPPNPPGKPQHGLPLHACMGLNACKGTDRLGNNACAGQGYCSTTADHTCHVKNDCRNQGGCGLYGTGEEMNQPGVNGCRSMGSCATPINAERFSTNGPNTGKSVWLRARAVFEQNWPAMGAELRKKQAQDKKKKKKQKGDIPPDQPLPEKLGPPPAAFAATGPTYLWMSDDNKKRYNMTACGASGLSGAGGCS